MHVSGILKDKTGSLGKWSLLWSKQMQRVRASLSRLSCGQPCRVAWPQALHHFPSLVLAELQVAKEAGPVGQGPAQPSSVLERSADKLHSTEHSWAQSIHRAVAGWLETTCGRAGWERSSLVQTLPGWGGSGALTCDRECWHGKLGPPC